MNRRNDFAMLIGGGCFAEFRGRCKNTFTVSTTVGSHKRTGNHNAVYRSRHFVNVQVGFISELSLHNMNV